MGAKRASKKKAPIPERWDRLFKDAGSFEKNAGPGHKHEDFDPSPAPHLNLGNKGNKIAFVFAAPGRFEADWCRPAAGKTGLNLNRVLGMLKAVCKQHFPHLDRYWYRITNSVSGVMYNEQNDESEPSGPQIKEKSNLDRFAKEIKDHTIIICFGECAWIAVKARFPPSAQAKTNGNWYRASQKLFIKTSHLSLLGLNQIRKEDLPDISLATIKQDDKKAERFRHELRLKICATEILAALLESRAWTEVPSSREAGNPQGSFKSGGGKARP